MKTVLISIITTIVTLILALLVIHLFWGEGCILSDDDHDKECTEKTEKKCIKKEPAHGFCMEKIEELRGDLEAKLTDEEKETITAMREKFDDDGHKKMNREEMTAYMAEHKEDIEAILVIADKHKDYIEGIYTKIHDSKPKMLAHHKCPEMIKCKKAQKKEIAEDSEFEMKCKKAEEECRIECVTTFKVHFLLMDEHLEDDEDDENEDED